MTNACAGPPGYIDHSALAALSADLCGDSHTVRRFISDFVVLWEVRLQRLRDAVSQAVLDSVYVVLLSIRTSANMLGAVLVEDCVTAMLSAVKQADLGACEAQMAQLDELGQETCRELDSFLHTGRARLAG